MKQNEYTNSAPTVVELGLETAIVEVEGLQELIDSLAEFCGPFETFLSADRGEPLQ